MQRKVLRLVPILIGRARMHADVSGSKEPGNRQALATKLFTRAATAAQSGLKREDSSLYSFMAVLRLLRRMTGEGVFGGFSD
jgi:hypothetical protein